MFAKPTDAQLENRYRAHVITTDQVERCERIRAQVLQTAKLIRDLTPCSAEQARALNALDEVMMLGNAAIARNE
jgi:hypothetical protein